MDEIVLALELAFFQAQDQGDVTHARIYIEVVDLLKPITDPADIDHEAIIDKVLDVCTEANLPTVSAFKAQLEGLPCQGCKA
jgi:hypothetical protein